MALVALGTLVALAVLVIVLAPARADKAVAIGALVGLMTLVVFALFLTHQRERRTLFGDQPPPVRP